MRPDRFITLNVVAPYRRAMRYGRPLEPQFSTTVSQLSSTVLYLPILMYHSISADAEPDVSPYYKTSTSPAIFRQHMEFFHSEGYQAISLQNGLKLLTQPTEIGNNCPQSNHPQPPSSRPILRAESLDPTPHARYSRFVVLTFDDGFRNFYTEAFPVLQNFGFEATMFLPTSFIGDTPRMFSPSTLDSSRQDRGAAGQLSTRRECLTWNEVKELHRAGIEFGSHTVTHPRLVDLSWAEIERELHDSKLEIEDKLGCAAFAFSYPYAFPQSRRDFIARFRNLLQSFGYTACVTTCIGCVKPGDDFLRLKRLPANDCDDRRLLQAKIGGAYDWLALCQLTSKVVKNVFAGTRVRPA